MQCNLLYRGVNPEHHARFNGQLEPKETKPFIKPAEFGRSEYNNIEFNESELNAVIEHQQHQAGYVTSGISTTPIFSRACFYATHNGKYEKGFIYVIDKTLCEIHNVAIYNVNELVPQPSIPEDEEVILVAHNNGSLPSEVVIEIKST